MPRPKRRRKMMNPPGVRGYRPFGIPGGTDSPVTLLYEEFEAIRLADYNKLSQEEAARAMDVSRPTFTRIYDQALKKLAIMLNEKRSLVIEGGNVQFDDDWYRCQKCHSVFKTSKKITGQCAICGKNDIHHINPLVE